MPTLEEIEEQILKEKNSIYFMPGEMKLLPIIIEDGEQIKMSHRSNFEGETGSLIVTNKRLVFLRYISPGNSRTESFWYSGQIKTITQRKTKGNGLNRDIIILDTANQEFEITHILGFHFEELMEYVKSKMEELSGTLP